MATDDEVLTEGMLGTGRNYELPPELPEEPEEVLEAATEAPEGAGVLEIPREAGVLIPYSMRVLMKGYRDVMEQEAVAAFPEGILGVQDLAWDALEEIAEVDDQINIWNRQWGPNRVVNINLPATAETYEAIQKQMADLLSRREELQAALDEETLGFLRRARAAEPRLAGGVAGQLPSLAESDLGRYAMDIATDYMEAPGPMGLTQAEYALGDEMLRQVLGDEAYVAFRELTNQTQQLHAYKGLSTTELRAQLEATAREMMESRAEQTRVEQMASAKFMEGDKAQQTIDSLRRGRKAVGYRTVRNVAENFRRTVLDNWPGGQENIPEAISQRLESGVDRIIKRIENATEAVLTDESAASKSATKAINDLNELMRDIGEQSRIAEQAVEIKRAATPAAAADIPEPAPRPTPPEAPPPGGGVRPPSLIDPDTGLPARDLSDFWDDRMRHLGDPPEDVLYDSIFARTVPGQSTDVWDPRNRATWLSFKEPGIPAVHPLVPPGEGDPGWSQSRQGGGYRWKSNQRRIRHEQSSIRLSSLSEAEKARRTALLEQQFALWDVERLRESPHIDPIPPYPEAPPPGGGGRPAAAAADIPEPAPRLPPPVERVRDPDVGAIREEMRRAGVDPEFVRSEPAPRLPPPEAPPPRLSGDLGPEAAEWMIPESPPNPAAARVAARLPGIPPASVLSTNVGKAYLRVMGPEAAEWLIDQLSGVWTPDMSPSQLPEMEQIILNNIWDTVISATYDWRDSMNPGALDSYQKAAIRELGIPENIELLGRRGLDREVYVLVERAAKAAKAAKAAAAAAAAETPAAASLSRRAAQVGRGARRLAGATARAGLAAAPFELFPVLEAIPLTTPRGPVTGPLMRTAGEGSSFAEERAAEREAGRAANQARLAEEEFWRTHTMDLNQMTPAERVRYDAWQKQEAEMEETLQRNLFSPEFGPGSSNLPWMRDLLED